MFSGTTRSHGRDLGNSYDHFLTPQGIMAFDNLAAEAETLKDGTDLEKQAVARQTRSPDTC